MFLGHFGLGLAGKRLAPPVSLGTLFLAPPPSEGTVAWTGLAMWIFVPWGWWIDRHRTVVGGPR